MSTTPIVTVKVAMKIGKFCDAFRGRWFHQPPEFTDPRTFEYFWDLYDRDDWCDEHPAYSGWYAQLLTSATESDLDAMVAAFDDKNTSYATAFRVYLVTRLANEAHKRYIDKRPVSSEIPEWLRKNGWEGIPDEWK